MNARPNMNANHAETAPAFLSVWDIHAYYGESYIVQGVSLNAVSYTHLTLPTN